MKKVAILQSNYVPWKGYFDMIAAVDELILFDDMQCTRRDWRNRNQIKTPQGVQWLTVPVKVKDKYHQSIRETEIEGTQWAMDHWKALLQNYRRPPCFNEIAAWLEPLYLAEPPTHLSQLNRRFIEAICAYLGIKMTISNSWDYPLSEGKSERLADLCVSVVGGECITRPAFHVRRVFRVLPRRPKVDGENDKVSLSCGSCVVLLEPSYQRRVLFKNNECRSSSHSRSKHQ